MLKPKVKTELIYPELSYKIIGLLYDVSNRLGSGYKEKYYQRALATEFKKAKLNFTEQVRIPLIYNGTKIGNYILDFLIENKVALEIKKDNRFSRTNIEQVMAYLKTFKLKLGILANFTSEGVKYRRILNIY